MVARHKGPRIHRPEGTAFREWYAALENLIQEHDGAPLANLLRRVQTVREGRRGLVPMRLLLELANLLDPQLTFSMYDQRRVKHNGVRLKITALTQKEIEIISKKNEAVGYILMAIEKGQSIQEAAIFAAEKLGLSERTILAYWTDARNANRYLDIAKARRKRPASPLLK